MPAQPQDHRPPARRQTAASKKREQKATDAELDRGIAVTDTDGKRLQVRIRDVKGTHDARLIEVARLDFVGLLEAMSRRQGLDLFAAVLWFARLVNGRESESYEEILERFGYEDFMAMDADEPKVADEAPKASASSSSTNSPD